MEKTVSSEFIRRWWRALLENAADLVDDADALRERGSYARAPSLTILAREEIAKASWVYGASEDAWTDTKPTVTLTGDLADARKLRMHGPKIAESLLMSIGAHGSGTSRSLSMSTACRSTRRQSSRR
ncbi:AbiV family abortive infection protein [Isoptericola dokdonensis]|uniref:Uncharacterized protein n=1 Tax=Isoptericola dokdonensis DS-3 TaxID=1300344 RepID=A0A168EEC5_9MICO|nr:AbiV family abortive infection protein [Isoptericola dokdonensis]ANC29933.1 hypothetical protein I598_0345 [Isoptericola dokdonensis DS-3]